MKSVLELMGRVRFAGPTELEVGKGMEQVTGEARHHAMDGGGVEKMMDIIDIIKGENGSYDDAML